MPNPELLATLFSSFGLIFLAEIGDKSQLVCMTLAARHRQLPVLLGAAAAFAVLNTLAVIFGAALAQWIPDYLLAIAVAILFAVFGIHSLMMNEADSEDTATLSSHSVFVTTFLLLLLAEMGDKTQLATAGLAATLPPIAVWLGSTLALLTTSAIGVWLGVTLLKRIPIHRLHQLSGLLFLLIAVYAVARAYESLMQ